MAYNRLSTPTSLDLAMIAAKVEDENVKLALLKIADFCTMLRSDITSQEGGAVRLNYSIDSNSVVDTDVPILKGLNITEAAGNISWSSGIIFYRDTAYNITGGTANNDYVYWQEGDSTLTGKDSILVSDLQSNRFWLATRVSGDVYNTPIASVMIAGLVQAGTIFTDHTFTGTLIVGSRTALTGISSGTGMYSDGNTGSWSVGVNDDAYISFNASLGTLEIGGASTTITGDVTIIGGSSGINTYYQSTAPATPNTGDVWYDTSGLSLNRYDGSTWNTIGDITSNKTSSNTNNVGSYSASVVSANAVNAESTLNTWAYSGSGSGRTTIDGGYLQTGTVVADTVVSTWVYAGNVSATQITTGTISASLTTTSNLILGTGGKIYTPGKSYGAGTNGIFIGYDSGVYKFDITNGSNYIRWDGINAPQIVTDKGYLGTSGGINYDITSDEFYVGNTTVGSEDYFKTYINSGAPTIDGIDYQSTGRYGVCRISPRRITVGHSSTAAYSEERLAFIAGANEDGTGGFSATGYSSFTSSNYSQLIFDSGGLSMRHYDGSSNTIYLQIDGNGSGYIGKDTGTENITLTYGDVSIPSSCISDGKTIMAYGSVSGSTGSKITGTDTGSVAWLSDREETGRYSLDINTGASTKGNWIIIAIYADLTYTNGNTRAIPSPRLSSGFFDNDTVGNIILQRNDTTGLIDCDWSFAAIRVS